MPATNASTQANPSRPVKDFGRAVPIGREIESAPVMQANFNNMWRAAIGALKMSDPKLTANDGRSDALLAFQHYFKKLWADAMNMPDILALWQPGRQQNGVASLQHYYDTLWRDTCRVPALPAIWRQSKLWHALHYGVIEPEADITETDKAFRVRIEVPGMGEDDIEISVEGNNLCIRGRKHEVDEQKGECCILRECAHGWFRRVLTLPEGSHSARAQAYLKNGVLVIDVPKKTEASRDGAQKVEVQRQA
ncbi:MAG: Hsp20/alpha crystallin family protein [Bdellovibrionales bacterium]